LAGLLLKSVFPPALIVTVQDWPTIIAKRTMNFRKYWKEFYEFFLTPKDEPREKVQYPGLLPAESGFLYAIIFVLIFILLFLALNA
jgi:hypothetical protein